MYPISNELLLALHSNSRATYIKGQLTLKDGTAIAIDSSQIVDQSLIIKSRCMGDDFSVGYAEGAELVVSLHMPNHIESLDGSVIELECGVEVNNSVEYIPLGIFNVAEPKRAPNDIIRITALDNMILLDEGIDGVGTSGTLYALTLYCCERCGVTFGMTEEQFSLLPNSKQHFILPSETSIETCRDLISCIAGLLGGYAVINRAGELEYRLYNPQSTMIIPATHRSGTLYDDFVVQYNGVQMDVGDSTYVRVNAECKGTTLVLESNPLLQGRSVEDIELALDNILEVITPICYIPYKTNYTGNPALDVGDFITLEGGNAKIPITSLVSLNEWKYHGKHRIEGQGINPKLKVKESQSTKRLNQTSALAQSSRETVYYFENASREVIKEQEEIIIEIQFAAVKKASPMFHATAQLELEQPGTVLFRYIIDNTPFEFTPQFQLPQGVSTVQLFYPLNGMSENKLHTFEVCVSSADTTGVIPKKAIQAVVVGQGLGSGEAMWDGRIRVSEEVMPFGLGNTISMQFTATATGTTEIPIPNGFTVPISPFKLGNGFTFSGFTEIVEMNIEEETGE